VGFEVPRPIHRQSSASGTNCVQLRCRRHRDFGIDRMDLACIRPRGRGRLLSRMQRRMHGVLELSAKVWGCYKFASTDYLHLQCMHAYSYCPTYFTVEMYTHTGLYLPIIRICNLSFITRLPVSAETEISCRSAIGGSAFMIRTPLIVWPWSRLSD